MFENPRRGRQARNFTTNVSKILDLKSSSEQIFFRKLSLGAPDSFLFYISKLLFVTVILYFCIHFHLAPVEGLFFKPKYRANILCICFNFIAVLFLFLSSPWGSVYRFCAEYLPRFQRTIVKYPYLTYGLMSWGTAYQTKLNKIKISQNNCIRCIFFANKRESPTPYFTLLEILKLENVFKLKIGTLNASA